MEKPIASIIFTHYGNNEARRKLGRASVISLYESVKHLPVELIVVDNGGNLEDSIFFLKETDEGRITHYVRNSDNLFFSTARNQALAISTGENICIVDNDLIYEKGWLDRCLDILKKTKGQKLFTSPMNIIGMHQKYTWEINIEGEKYKVNPFVGSNCWVMRREDYEVIGNFENHYISGSNYCRHYNKLGYAVVAIPGNLVRDVAIRAGIMQTVKKMKIEKQEEFIIKKKLLNGEEIILIRQRL